MKKVRFNLCYINIENKLICESCKYKNFQKEKRELYFNISI